jgi:hypothetical protein
MEELEERFKRSRAEFERATKELDDCQERAKRLKEEIETLRVEADLAERAVGRFESDSTVPSPGTILSLPDEILTKIMFYVDRRTAMYAVPLVNRRLHCLMADTSNLRAIMGVSDMDIEYRPEILLASISRENAEVMRTQPEEVRLVRPFEAYPFEYTLFGKTLDPRPVYTRDGTSHTTMFKDQLWVCVYDSQCTSQLVCDTKSRRITFRNVSLLFSRNLIVATSLDNSESGILIHVFDGVHIREILVNKNVNLSDYRKLRGNVVLFPNFYVVVAGDEAGKIVAGDFYYHIAETFHARNDRKAYEITQPSIDTSIGTKNTKLRFLAKERIQSVVYCENAVLSINRYDRLGNLYWIGSNGEARIVKIQNGTNFVFGYTIFTAGVITSPKYFENVFAFLQFPWSASSVK